MWHITDNYLQILIYQMEVIKMKNKKNAIKRWFKDPNFYYFCCKKNKKQLERTNEIFSDYSEQDIYQYLQENPELIYVSESPAIPLVEVSIEEILIPLSTLTNYSCNDIHLVPEIIHWADNAKFYIENKRSLREVNVQDCYIPIRQYKEELGKDNFLILVSSNNSSTKKYTQDQVYISLKYVLPHSLEFSNITQALIEDDIKRHLIKYGNFSESIKLKRFFNKYTIFANETALLYSIFVLQAKRQAAEVFPDNPTPKVKVFANIV